MADQLGAVDDGHALYDRANTRYEQLDDLRAAFGFQAFAPGHRREVWHGCCRWRWPPQAVPQSPAP